jgi:hypothetical protein
VKVKHRVMVEMCYIVQMLVMREPIELVLTTVIQLLLRVKPIREERWVLLFSH